MTKHDAHIKALILDLAKDAYDAYGDACWGQNYISIDTAVERAEDSVDLELNDELFAEVVELTEYMIDHDNDSNPSNFNHHAVGF